MREMAIVLAIMVLMVIAIAVVGGSCTAAVLPAPGTPVLTNVNAGTFTVFRFTDLDGAATCWLYTGYREGGISCIPTKDIGRCESLRKDP